MTFALPVVTMLASAGSSRWQHEGAPELWNVLDEATRVAERSLTDPKEWWRVMGHTAQVPLQVTSLRGQFSRNNSLRDAMICEIGFNAGHSAIVWLEGTKTRLATFDLLHLNYSRSSRRFIEAKYPGRVTFHEGSSALTVPQYVERIRQHSEPACDLWLIDGDHGKHVDNDFFSTMAASHDQTVVIADDAGLLFPYVRRVWRTHVALGSIRERGCVSTRVKGNAVEKTWCHGLVEGWAAGTESAPRLRKAYEDARAWTREQRNTAYFEARRRGRVSANATSTPGDPQVMRAGSRRNVPALGALQRARRAARMDLKIHKMSVTPS